ncbi:MauE/DoxX family redox-associated membrane protein [Nonomuraea sp. NPDC049480]|uniref:MauE/DoxX family redox-associated membrane protein n=1 Tax=Nonomuraea sp. NPDC049480 TaxID=3364353 RepID=UPI0037A7F6AB
MDYVVSACRFVIGAIFLVAVCGKALRPSARAALAALVSGIAGTARPGPVVVAVICAEAGTVVLVAVPGTARAGLVVAAALLAMFAAAIGVGLRREVSVPCGCFGRAGAPLGAAHLLRNVLLTVIALTGTVAARPGVPAGSELAGVALSLIAGAVLTLVFVFFDDIAALFAVSDPMR